MTNEPKEIEKHVDIDHANGFRMIPYLSLGIIIVATLLFITVRLVS